MNIKKIGNRGVLFIYDDLEMLTYIYLINTDNRIFLCDTFLGPDSMLPVKEYINNNIGNKPITIFNSHSDYDHIWGNCAFHTDMIVAHEKCREFMLKHGEKIFSKFQTSAKGDVKLKPANITFSDKLCFKNEKIDFFYSPGHTFDSASCFDNNDKILFVGDNLELPIPYIYNHNLKIYLETLKYYQSIKASIIITAHSGIVDSNLIDETISYIENIASYSAADVYSQFVHISNLKTILVSKYEALAIEKFKNYFDTDSFDNLVMQQLEKNNSVEDMEQILQNWFNEQICKFSVKTD